MSASARERVVIDRMNLVCRRARGIASADRFVAEVLSDLERELETLLPSRSETIAIPRVDVQTTVRAMPGATSAAVAKAIARAIASAAAAASASPERSEAARSSPDTARGALAVPTEIEARLVEALSGSRWSLDALGLFARKGHLPLLLAWLTRDRAHELLGVLARDMSDGRPTTTRSHVRAIDVVTIASAAVGSDVARELGPQVALVIAIAWTARLGPDVVRTSAAWRDALRSHQAVGTVASDVSLDDASGPTDVADATDRNRNARGDTHVEDRERGMAEESEPPPRMVGDAVTSLASRIAGCAFVATTLYELGWDRAASAIRGDARLLLCDVLHASVVAAGIDAADVDPAPWIFAGLLAAPLDEDIAADAAGWSEDSYAAMARAAGGEGVERADVVDAWTRAVLDDLTVRLDTSDTSCASVVGIPGRLRSDDDEVLVTMPFTPAYEPLLRTGLLMDRRDIAWLDGRGLRFEFEEDA